MCREGLQAPSTACATYSSSMLLSLEWPGHVLLLRCHWVVANFAASWWLEIMCQKCSTTQCALIYKLNGAYNATTNSWFCFCRLQFCLRDLTPERFWNIKLVL